MINDIYFTLGYLLLWLIPFTLMAGVYIKTRRLERELREMENKTNKVL